MRKHHSLKSWQLSRHLVYDIYELTKGFPKNEQFGLTAQMCRSAISIPSNIAEGAARMSVREFNYFLSIARGSLAELETQLLLSKDIGLISDISIILSKIDRLFALIGGLINQQKNKIKEEASTYEDLTEHAPTP